MHRRTHNRSANHRELALHNPSINTSKQKQQIPSSSALNNATNHELKQIIQNLISKTRSLISSLENTLKQLQETRIQKDFWKEHYFAFRTACEKCINSRGIAPFEYINELEKTVREWGFKKQQEMQSALNQSSTMNLKIMSLANSRMKVNFRTDYDGFNKERDLASKDSLVSENNFLNSSKPIQIIQNTQPKTPTKPYNILDSQQKVPLMTIELQKPQHSYKSNLDAPFTGIRLGHTNSKKKSSPQNINAKILDKTFKRKDSIETKKIEIFSFAQHKNNSKNLNKTLELNH